MAGKIFLTLIILMSLTTGFAQEKYWVYFTDKKDVTFNPYSYFDAKAIQRRLKSGISLYDSTDFPLNQNYIQKVSPFADTISGHSRWLNAIAIAASPSNLDHIASLPFVKSIEKMHGHAQLTVITGQTMHQGEKELATAQINWMGGSAFINNGFTGKGIRICIIDAGFPSVNEAPVFEHIRNRNGIIQTWDFVKNKPNVYKFNGHGTMVMSCIAGKTDAYQLGLATDAEFLLARTEKMLSEGHKEEELWLMAVEWADKNGADIISSSLGYTNDIYFKEEMNGKTSTITRAGNLAAKKGMLVINSAGNDGDKNWKYIGAPSDGDSVLAIGAINPWTGLHTSFSSFGPTADHRIKPNLTAFGHTISYHPNYGFMETQGTSFSCPLVAGFAACAWQADSSLTNMELFRKLEQSGSLFPYYDYAHGYGVPQASAFVSENTTTQDSTFTINYTEYTLEVIINKDDFSIEDEVVIDYYPYIGEEINFLNKWHIIDDFRSSDSHVKQPNPGYFYYNFENEEGYLDEYFILAVYDKKILTVDLNEHQGKKLNLYYKGYKKTIDL